MSKSKQQTWYECPFASFKTVNRTTLIKHIIYKHGFIEYLFACPYCDFQGDKGQVTEHVLSEHTKKIQLLSEKYTCPICKFETKTLDDQVNHIDITHQFKKSIS